MKTMQNRLALSVALSLAVMAGSAYAGSLKSTVGLKTDGTLENVSKIEATSSLEGNRNTVTVTIQANGTEGRAYGVFSNMYSTTDTLDSYASNLNVVVSGSSFNTTTSINAGGALTLWNSALWNGGEGLKHQVVNSTFTGNSAKNLGGALSLMSYNTIANPGTTTVSGSTFANNKVTEAGASGGAIYAEGTNLVVTDTEFSGNEATRRGGAIYTDAAASTKIQNATFTDNSSKNAGGAVALSDFHANSALTATIENSTFTGNNTVRKGGALVIFDEEGHQFLDVKVNNVKFTDNHANGSDTENGTGGAIHSESDLTVKGNSVFTGNTASGKGGAIYLGETDAAKQQGNTASLKLSTGENETIHFADNKAGDKANDIYLASGTSSTFEGQGRIELMSGLAGEGTVTSSAANVYVEDVTGFTGDLTISGGVFSVNGAAFIDTDNQVFGQGADITIGTEGTLNLANVTHAGKITLTNGMVTDNGAITFDNKFLAGSVDGGVLTVTTNNELIGNSGFGSDSQEVQDNLNALFERGLSTRESDIMTRISQQYADGNALSGEGVEAFRQATGGSVTAGAFNVAYDAQTQFTDSIVRHQISEHNGYGVWADVYYTSNEAKTLYGSSGYETDIYGGVFGFDATFSCGATAGIAVTVGTGDTDTVGELRSNLDTDFYGIALYTSKDFGGLDTKLDVGYMKFDNDFSGLGDAGDVDAWTVGLRGDFKAYQGEVMSITPHVGVRYSHFESDAVAFNDKTTLNVFETPVGVAFNGNFETAGWKIVPTLDFSIVPQLGDKDVDTFAGNVDVIDNLYNTTLGVAATYQNLTFGLDYRYGFGNEERSNNAVNLKVRYSF